MCICLSRVCDSARRGADGGISQFFPTTVTTAAAAVRQNHSASNLRYHRLSFYLAGAEIIAVGQFDRLLLHLGSRQALTAAGAVFCFRAGRLFRICPVPVFYLLVRCGSRASVRRPKRKKT
nr:unnamed protein product [Callosobruchus chinensis]